MRYNPTARTFDYASTLDDSEVLAFCRDGHLLLPGVVAEEINRRVARCLPRRAIFPRASPRPNWNGSAVPTNRAASCWRSGFWSTSCSIRGSPG